MNCGEILRVFDIDSGQPDWSDFAADQLDAAFDELNDRWVRSGGPPAFARIERRLRRAIGTDDIESMRPLFADDFVAVDHRLLGLGRRNADEYIESITPLLNGLQMLTVAYPRHSDSLSLAHALFVTTDGSTLGALMVAVVEGDRLARYEMFPITDLDAAITRYEELADASSVVEPGA